MQRRTYLKTVLAASAGTPFGGAQGQHPPIQLHVDLTVDAAREKEFVRNFHAIFQPAASKQPGYLDVRILKLRTTMAGKPPGDANYRFVLTFQSEELRQKWVATEVHKKVWPELEKTFRHKEYTTLLFDAA